MTKEELEKEAEEYFEQYKVTDEDYVVSPYSDDMGKKMLMYNDEYYAEETYLRLYTQGYLAGAEPREKRIAELEKENAELKKEVEKHKWNDIFLEENAFYDKMIAEEYTTLQERIKQLEKENQDLRDNYEDFKAIAIPEREHLHNENAELKGLKDVATLIRANNDTVVTLMQLNNKLVSKSQQLTKAKELLAKWVELFKPKGGNIPPTPIQVDTEQFLSEVEK